MGYAALTLPRKGMVVAPVSKPKFTCTDWFIYRIFLPSWIEGNYFKDYIDSSVLYNSIAAFLEGDYLTYSPGLMPLWKFWMVCSSIF